MTFPLKMYLRSKNLKRSFLANKIRLHSFLVGKLLYHFNVSKLQGKWVETFRVCFCLVVIIGMRRHSRGQKLAHIVSLMSRARGCRKAWTSALCGTCVYCVCGAGVDVAYLEGCVSPA